MEKPNLIYILADDMGYGDLSCLNEKSKIKTPNFDSLAAAGLKCTDAHASSAVCTPSRYSILTSRYNWRSVLKSGVTGGYSPPLLECGRMTVASMLKGAGYRTACVGKWHLGLQWARTAEGETIPESPGFETTKGIDYAAPISDGPLQHGFDYFYGIAASLDMPPYVYIENDRATEIPDHETEGFGKQFWRKGPTGPNFKHEEVLPRLTEKTLDLIDEWGSTGSDPAAPFFIYFPLPAPHTPILPTERFQGCSKTNEYGDFVAMCDDLVGQIMKKLEEKGIADNTILMFTSDNGCSPMADFSELESVGHNPSYIFRGHKADIYEGGHRIPLLVRWPAGIKAGSIVAETVCLSDLTATMADILEFKLPENAAEDSYSNLPIWQRGAETSPGTAQPTPVRPSIVHHSINGSFSIRKGKWKLEMCPGSGGWSYPRPGEEPPGAPVIQLYDMEADISERTNVQDRYPDIVAALKAELTTIITSGRSTPGTPQKNTGPEYWEQLAWMRG